ncbi:major capsid protein [Nonomuraea sp. NPDC050790]|uniref:major capsid protein n=1 Tax=Nonomuraea sp. NPDC050790 TaxID=3364371 RepID=UPI0037A68F6C
MERFELPDDITALDDVELSALLEGAVAAFDALSTSDRVAPDDLAELRRLSTAVADIRNEMQARVAEAEAAAAEIDQLAAQVRGTPVEEPVEAAVGGEPVAADEPDAPEEPVTASSAVVPRQRPALDLSGVRRRMPSVLPPAPAPGPEITASVDVPGYQPGQPLDMDGVTEGIIRRANALKTAGGGVGLTASYRLPFDRDLIINDSSSGTEGTRAVILAADQSRLPASPAGERNIVASGGWCAPSETVYELTDIACPEMLWDLPEIQLARGGLRYFPIPSLDVASMTFVHTEADDIAGSTKPCFKIPCPDPIEVRCDAIGVCLESGILTQRHFPELVAWYQRNVMVAHELRIRQHLFEAALTQATPVTIAATFGALSAIYAAIALQAADMVERHSLCDSINVEVTLPWWSRSLMLADLARQNGRRLDEVRVQELVDLFATLGVRIQWARGLGPAVPTDIGGLTPAVDWPAQLQFLIYVAGSLQAGRGGEISLGVIHDSTKFSTNDYTALFSEECVALINRGPDLRLITVPICPNGATAAQITAACPIA